MQRCFPTSGAQHASDPSFRIAEQRSAHFLEARSKAMEEAERASNAAKCPGLDKRRTLPRLMPCILKTYN